MTNADEPGGSRTEVGTAGAESSGDTNGRSAASSAPTVGQTAHAQERRGAEVVHVSFEPDGRIPLKPSTRRVDARTELVCRTAVS